MNGSELNQDSKPLPARLPSSAIFGRLTAIGALLAVTAGLFLYAGGWFTPRALTPAAIINTFERVNGVHPGFRRNHAKGVCVTGYFESNGAGTIALQSAGFPLPAACPSWDGLHWRADSRTLRTRRKPYGAWRFCSNCPTAKSGALP